MTRARIEDAFAFMAAGEVAQAVRLLQALAAETPAHATVHVLLAQGYERLHRWPDALGAWQAAALLMPDALVVRQGALRATRVLAALRAMADDGAMLAVGTPSGQRLMPVEVPTPLGGSRDAFDTSEAAEDPLATLSYTAGTPLGMPDAPDADALPGLPGDPHDGPYDGPPDGAVHVSPPLSARPYTPATTTTPQAEPLAAAPEETDVPTSPNVAPQLVSASLPVPEGLATFFDEATADAPRSAPAPAPAGLDLDRLIDQLAQSGPIRPRADLDAIPPPPLDLDEDDDPVSETLARIYAGQRQFAQAVRIYERLAERQPEQAVRFRAEADALRVHVTP